MRKQKREKLELPGGNHVGIFNLHVTCDWCINQQKEPPATFVSRASGTLPADAARLGWHLLACGIDVCPACALEDGLEPPTVSTAPDVPVQLDLFSQETP